MAKVWIGNFKGPKGDTGAAGPKGTDGAKGDTGAAGPKGATGDKGATGTRGSRWSSGTAITGTSATATIFSGTGISDALVNDEYLNTNTGNTYRCTVAGAANVAKWVYTGNIKGATGAQGPKGDTGAAGADGAKGDTGAAGPKGATGDKGATGTRGSRWSSGTAITGTSATATIFSGTGISDALVNDQYLNTSTGNVYRCTVAGAADVAKWVYVCNVKGAKGDTGAKGDKGDKGATGDKGEKGDKGDTPTTADNMTVAFTQASSRANIATGEKMNTIMGKIKKWFADMTTAAFAQIITSDTDLMALTKSGYLADALAVKNQFDEVNGKLDTLYKSTFYNSNVMYASGNIECKNGNVIVSYYGDVNNISGSAILGTVPSKYIPNHHVGGACILNGTIATIQVGSNGDITLYGTASTKVALRFNLSYII